MTDYKKLVQKAAEAMSYAYSPYSGFCVGAALLCKSGRIYTGCNIENISFSATNCAERTAFFKALSEGENEFCAIAVVGGKNGKPEDHCMPCGICRQVMAEFCSEDFEIVTAKDDDIRVYTLSGLLPKAFSNKF